MKKIGSFGAASLPFILALAAGCSADAGNEEVGSLGEAQSFGSASDGPSGRYRNQTDFVGARATFRAFPFNRAATELGDGVAVGAPAREVKESDVYRLVGNTLYILNPFRGLEILDVSRADSPRRLGRVEIFGSPSEMYVDEARGRAYLLVGDTARYENKDIVRTSRVVTVDVSSRAAPRVIGSVDVAGYVVESRVVGDVLYVVSSQWTNTPTGGEERTSVASIKLGASRPYQVERVEFEGGAYQLHASADHLFVAKRGGESTEIEVIGIASAAGRIARGSKVTVPGYLQDRFQMNMDTSRGVLRVVSHHWDGNGTIFIKTFAIGAPASARELGSLTLPNIGTLLATKFDGAKGYLVHQVRIDPIDVIDFSNPAAPVRLSSLEIPGWMEHLEVRGNRVLGIGMDTVNGRQQVATAIYDVSDPTRTREMSRAILGDGSSWQWANFWDARSFRLLDDRGLLLVPFTNSTNTGSETVLQLVDVNLAAGTLAARGHIDQAGDSTRSFAVRQRVGSFGSREFSVADVDDRQNPRIKGSVELSRNISSFVKLSNAGIQLVSEYDRSPELRAVPVSDADAEKEEVYSILPIKAAERVFASGNHAIVATHSYPETGSPTLTLRAVDYGNPRNPRVRGSATISIEGALFGYGQSGNSQYDVLQVAADLFVVTTANETTRTFRLVSFANADAPSVVGNVSVPAAGELQEVRVDDGDVYVTHFVPQAAPKPPVSDTSEPTAPVSDEMIRPIGQPGVERGRYYVTKVSVGRRSLTASRPVNVPGVFVDVDAQGHVVTLDSRVLPGDAGVDKNIDVLDVDFSAARARLKGLLDVDDGVTSVLVRDGSAFYTTTELASGGFGGGPIPMAMRIGFWQQPKNWQLHTVAIQGFQLQEKGQITLLKNGAGTILDVARVGNGTFAFASMSGGGVGIVDVSDLRRPELQSFAPANGWFDDVIVDGARREAILWSGQYGVSTLRIR